MDEHRTHRQQEGRRRLVEVVAWLEARYSERGQFPERPRVRAIREHDPNGH